MNVTLDGGMQEEYFGSAQSINEEKVMGRNKPLFQNIEKSPLQLSVVIAYEEQWTEDHLRELRRWLTEPEYYASLIFSNNPEKIFYALYIDDPRLIHVNSQGYIELTFRCNDSYAYSPIMTKEYEWVHSIYKEEITDFSLGEKKTMVINSDGHLMLNPVKKRLDDFSPNIKLFEIGL